MHHGHHLTPSEVARRSGLSEEEVLLLCAKTSVPVLHGRIDKSLFDLARREQERKTRYAA
jgi:hypothetical protein